MDIVRDKKVNTYKEHQCFGCGRTFPPHSSLRALTSADGGYIRTEYWCDTCTEYWSIYMEYGDEIGFAELRTEDRVGWDNVRRRIEGNFYEEEIR